MPDNPITEGKEDVPVPLSCQGTGLPLTRRQYQCLRLVSKLKTSKDIGRQLELSPNTVSGYIAEAVAALGARDRRHAAELLLLYESDPQAFRAEFSRLAPSSLPSPSTVGREAGHFWLPLRTKGAIGNDNTFFNRIGWVFGITLAFAIGFGALAAGIRVISDLIVRIFGH